MHQSSSLAAASARGLGAVLLSEVLCLFISFTCAAIAVSLPVMKYVSILCTAGIYIGVLGDFAFRLAKQAALEHRRDGTSVTAARFALPALVCALPALALWVTLLVSRANGGNFLTLYRFLNAPFFQLLTLICGEQTLPLMPWRTLLLFGLMVLVPFATVLAVALVSYRREKK